MSINLRSKRSQVYPAPIYQDSSYPAQRRAPVIMPAVLARSQQPTSFQKKLLPLVGALVAAVAIILFIDISRAFAADAEGPTTTNKTTANAKPAARPSSSSASQLSALESGNDENSDETAGAPAAALTVGSWGGAYMQSQKIAYFAPYHTQTGIPVTAVTVRGVLAALRALKDDAKAAWDVVDLHQGGIDQGCREGLLAPLDSTAVIGSHDGDFLPGAIHKCGVASMAWSSLIVFDRRQFRRRKPASLKDFFNIRRFPGRRALPDGPEYTLELALMADGVPTEEVYAVLSTDDGVRRAFRKLDRIKDRVLWWKKGMQPLKALIGKKVSMAMAFNGRVFQSAMRHPGRLGLIWQGQIYELEFWAVPKHAENRQKAVDFIKFAVMPERLARQSRWFPYGPTRLSALSMIGKHAELGVSMTPYIPTAKRNFRKAMQRNMAWWRQNKPRMSAIFADWKAGRPILQADESSDEKPNAEKVTSPPAQ